MWVSLKLKSLKLKKNNVRNPPLKLAYPSCDITRKKSYDWFIVHLVLHLFIEVLTLNRMDEK